MQVFMCDSFLRVLCGCCAKSSTETEPEEPFWVHYVSIHHRGLVSMRIRGHIRLLRVLLQHLNNTQQPAAEQNTLESETRLCLGLGRAPKRGQLSVTEKS